MSEEQLWHYIVEGEQQGPVSVEQLHGLVANGTVTPDTQVWTNSLEEWTTASNLEGLFPDEAVVGGGARLITGAAAQTATPLAAQVAQPAMAQAGGFSLGGSLGGGPHLPAAGLMPGTKQQFQVRSVGILQSGVFGACLGIVAFGFNGLLWICFFGALVAKVGGGGSEAAYVGVGLGAFIVIGLILSGLVGFIYGLIAALVYNLAARMCGGIVIRVQAKPDW